VKVKYYIPLSSCFLSNAESWLETADEVINFRFVLSKIGGNVHSVLPLFKCTDVILHLEDVGTLRIKLVKKSTI